MSSYPNETQDRLAVLYQQEVSFYLTTDYLSAILHRQGRDSKSDDGTSSGSNSKMLNQHWREVMCEWAYHGKYGARLMCVTHAIQISNGSPQLALHLTLCSGGPL